MSEELVPEVSKDGSLEQQEPSPLEGVLSSEPQAAQDFASNSETAAPEEETLKETEEPEESLQEPTDPEAKIKEMLGDDYIDLGSPVASVLGKSLYEELATFVQDTTKEITPEVTADFAVKWTEKYKAAFGEDGVPPLKFTEMQVKATLEQERRAVVAEKEADKELETGLKDLEGRIDFTKNPDIEGILKRVTKYREEFSDFATDPKKFVGAETLLSEVKNLSKGKGDLGQIISLFQKAESEFNLTKQTISSAVTKLSAGQVQEAELVEFMRETMAPYLPANYKEILLKSDSAHDIWKRFKNTVPDDVRKKVMFHDAFQPKYTQ
jgi:hypothetical protein